MLYIKNDDYYNFNEVCYFVLLDNFIATSVDVVILVSQGYYFLPPFRRPYHITQISCSKSTTDYITSS